MPTLPHTCAFDGACSCVLFLNIVMGIKTLQVILKDTVEGGPGVFFSGSSVAGAVHISVDGESQTAKGIVIATYPSTCNHSWLN